MHDTIHSVVSCNQFFSGFHVIETFDTGGVMMHYRTINILHGQEVHQTRPNDTSNFPIIT